MIFNYPNHTRRHSLFQIFPLLDASVPKRLWQPRSHKLQQGSIVTPCPAVVGPSVSFFVHLLLFLGKVFRKRPSRTLIHPPTPGAGCINVLDEYFSYVTAHVHVGTLKLPEFLLWFFVVAVALLPDAQGGRWPDPQLQVVELRGAQYRP